MAPVNLRVRFASILIVLLRKIWRVFVLFNFTEVLFAYLKYLGSNCVFTLTRVKLWYPVKKAQEVAVPLLPFFFFLINVRGTNCWESMLLLQSAGAGLDSVS